MTNALTPGAALAPANNKEKKLGTRSSLTFKANVNSGRYGWLRLTPAYSFNLVNSVLSDYPSDSVVLEPFSGSATTPLVAANMGLNVYAREINPFLVWFGQAKTASYSPDDLELTAVALDEIANNAPAIKDFDALWQPDIFHIERWWNEANLSALKAIRSLIDETDGQVRNLLDVAFCRELIACSNATFNHPSMGFKEQRESLRSFDYSYKEVIDAYVREAHMVIETAAANPQGACKIELGDSCRPFSPEIQADIVITSPPYANRMSYIRELRPYMYWMRFLNTGQEAGELDWDTIGGTWGSATTKLKSWKGEVETPIDEAVDDVCSKIIQGKSGEVLSPYVRKYFYDMWQHFTSIKPAIKDGGRICYIVGNSTFSGTMVPAQEWYAEMMRSAGFKDVHIETIRKRNCNKQLYEYAVEARK